LEFLLINLFVWADKDAFVLPKLEIEIERRLQGKISTSDRRLEVTSVEIAIVRCVSYFFSSYYYYWVGVIRAGDGKAYARRMKRDAWTFGGFIPGSVSSVADLFPML
jgi:hypothetical protein